MVCAKSQDYDVLLSYDVLDPANRSLADAIAARPSLVVTDRTVESLYGDRLRAYLSTLPAPAATHVAELTEHTKTIETMLEVCAAAQAHGIGRRDPLVAVGGGLCADVVSVA